MRKKIAAWLTILIFPLLVLAEQPPIQNYVFRNVNMPSVPLTKNWQFVIDNSSSTHNIFGLVRAGLFESLKFPTDEMNISVITFNDRGMERRLDWMEMSPEAIRKADDFVQKTKGVLSYGRVAIDLAIRQNKERLTIVLISDGGFTEACNNRGFGVIDRCIKDAQKWREDNGLGKAIIVSIGIENKHYTAGGKPPDEECQAFMQKVGTENGGGYFHVSKEK